MGQNVSPQDQGYMIASAFLAFPEGASQCVTVCTDRLVPMESQNEVTQWSSRTQSRVNIRWE